MPPNKPLSEWTTEELEASLAAPPVNKPLGEWTVQELEASLANEPRAKLTVRPRHVDAMLAQQGQREAGEPLKPSFLAAGGTLGALVGMPGGPVGAVAGGALGTAAGGFAYDLYRDVRRGLVDDPSVPPSNVNRLMEPVKEGLVDAAISGGIAGVPAITAGWRGMKRGLMGVTENSAQLAKEAELRGPPVPIAPGIKGSITNLKKNALGVHSLSDMGDLAPKFWKDLTTEQQQRGIGLGISDVAEKTPVKTFTNTVARMPFIGGPMKRAQAQKLEQVHRAWDRELGAFGPTRSADDLSSELLAKGEGTFSGFRNAVEKRYSNAKVLAEAEGAVIPTTPVVKAAQLAEFELLSARPLLASGETMSSVAPEYIRKFLAEAQELGPQMSVKEADWLIGQVNVLMDKAKKDGFQWKQADNIRSAAEQALRSMDAASPAARALREADDFFHRGMKQFETPTGQRFGKVDKNLFKVGYERPGTLNPDELVEVVMNAKSPKAVVDLESLVGHEAMAGVSRRYLERAYQGAQEVTDTGARVFDINKFTTALHLNDSNSSQFKVLEHLYKANGGDIADLKKLVEISSKIFGNQVPDVSTFVARRAMLGGAKSAITAIVPGGAAAVSHIAAGGTGIIGAPVLLGTLLARHGVRIASEPKYLKALLRVYNPDLPKQVKWMNLGRLVRMLARDESPQEPQLEPSQAAAENALMAQ